MCSYQLLLGPACASPWLLWSPLNNMFFPEEKFPFAGTLAPTPFHKVCRVHWLFLSLQSEVWWVQASTLSKILQGNITTLLHPLLWRLFNLNELPNAKCQLCQGQEFSAWVLRCIAPRWELQWGCVDLCKQRPEVGNGCLPQSLSTIYFETRVSFWTWSSLIQLDWADREGQHLP